MTYIPSMGMNMDAATRLSKKYWKIAERSGAKQAYDNLDIIELEQYARTGAYRKLALLGDLEIVKMWNESAYHVFAWHPKLRVLVFFLPPDVADSLQRCPLYQDPIRGFA